MRKAGKTTAKSEALRACHALVSAYASGEADGGSVEWELIDEAHRVALSALSLERRPVKRRAPRRRPGGRRRSNAHC